MNEEQKKFLGKFVLFLHIKYLFQVVSIYEQHGEARNNQSNLMISCGENNQNLSLKL